MPESLRPDDHSFLGGGSHLNDRLRELCDRAKTCSRRTLTLKHPNMLCSIDQGIFGHRTRRNLAAERGDQYEADKLWHQVLLECPGDEESLAKLGSAK
jgi:hypothetical protein